MRVHAAQVVPLLVALSFTTPDRLAAQNVHRADTHTGGAQQAAFATGHYRNLLAEDGHTDAEIQARLRSTFSQLFGQPLSSRHSTGMVATTAVGSLAASNTPEAKAFVRELWASPVPSGEQRYYDGLLYMMSLLHTSGQFRIWGPSATPAHAQAAAR